MNEIFGLIGAAFGVASLVAMVVLVGTWKGHVDEQLKSMATQLDSLAVMPSIQERLTRLEERAMSNTQRLDLLWNITVADPLLSLKRKGLMEEHSDIEISPEMQARFGPRGLELSQRLMGAIFAKPVPDHDSTVIYDIIQILSFDIVKERAGTLDLTIPEYLALCLTSIRMEQRKRASKANQ